MSREPGKQPHVIHPEIYLNLDRLHETGPIKMVVFDLDGTILNESRIISQRNKEAVHSLRDAGIEYTLASGRTELQMRLYAEELDVRLPIIACNGAVVYDHREDRNLYRKQMSEQLIVDALEYLIANRMDFMCYSAECIYYPDYGRKIEVMHLYNEKARASGSRLIRTETVNNRVREVAAIGMVKILVMIVRHEDRQAICDIVAPHDATVVASMSDALDIMAPNVSKGSGMAQLASIRGIDLKEVVAFGDHDNDASMLAMAGTGIAMGQATAAARAVADLIAPPCDDDGVAIAIESYILPRARKQKSG